MSRRLKVIPSGWQQNSVCILNNYMWIINDIVPKLVKISINELEVSYSVNIPGVDFNQNDLYKYIFEYDNFIYLIPFNALGIKIYNTKENKFIEHSMNDISMIRYAYKHEYYLYLFSLYTNKDVVKIDMRNHEIEKKISTVGVPDGCFSVCAGFLNDYLYLPVYLDRKDGGILKFGIINEDMHYINCNTAVDIVLNNSNNIIFANRKGDIYEFISGKIGEIKYSGDSYRLLSSIEGIVYGETKKEILEFDRRATVEHSNNIRSNRINALIKIEDKFIRIDRNNGCFESYDLNVNFIETKNIYIDVEEKNLLLHESQCLSLFDFIDYL